MNETATSIYNSEVLAISDTEDEELDSYTKYLVNTKLDSRPRIPLI